MTFGTLGSGSMVYEPRLGLAGFESRFRPKLKAQSIELEELWHL
jgi:hypothetical protein